MARKTWQTAADWQAGVAENLEITDAGVKLARPEPAQFTRASEAYKSDGTLIPSGAPRYEGAGVRVEPGTTNLIPLANQKFEGWTAYNGAVATLTQNQIVPEWGASDATRIQTSGGASIAKYRTSLESPSVLGKAYSQCVYVKNIGATPVLISTSVPGGTATPVLPGEIRLVKIENNIGNGTTSYSMEFRTANIEDSLDFIAWRPMAEARSYCTSFTDGTRSPESLSVPVPFTPQQGGEISFIADVNDACKRQVAGEYPALLWMTKADGALGFTIAHSPTSAIFYIEIRDDANAVSYKGFADTLIPNGTRTLDVIHDKAIPAVILKCDGNEIAQITNPKLPSGWGRAYLGSDAAGKNQAGTTVGNLRMVVG
jgi:hypothetical protein